MANTDYILAIPNQETTGLFAGGATAQQSLVMQSGSQNWRYSDWLEIKENIAVDINIYSLAFQPTNVISTDTTIEYLFEIGTGTLNNMVTRIQAPYSIRCDTAVGIYLNDSRILLSEPVTITAGSHIYARMTASVANYRVDGFRIMYTATKSIWTPEWYSNNYKRIKVPNGMGTSIGGVR